MNKEKVKRLLNEVSGLKQHEWQSIKNEIDREFTSIANKNTLTGTENVLNNIFID